MATHAGAGRIDWIGLRTERRGEVREVTATDVELTGLVGDRHSRANRRSVTLIQTEHLPVIASLLGRDIVQPSVLRRNICVSGINLIALRGVPLRLGTAVIEITTICAPCSRMEEVLGPGGYNAMRGHGGWTAKVLEPGHISFGAEVAPLA
ncbi:MOSC domain-containing protein [Meridianimarinicoccus aquatilis]|uniref:MOSC domain-containing protein n=1 Tax=Meridianimarinicoccus aquatilis TaxID=2552766 RepID=A0A4R6ATU6_9RHOB|nr:MOSC domain-containing protein [Fluviibacterium aquatile]QIE41634.1 MOSC domain-containing protein [Rhodobacteraceae bacterium SC52]TDL88011.1 MOSC domain-containing protein [Fluviibacterium aquatile]